MNSYVPVIGNSNPAVGTGSLTSAVYCQRATLAYTDTAAKTLFTIPDGAVIVGWVLSVTTLFNSDGTDLVDIGVTGTAEKFAADVDVSSTGLKSTGIVAAQVGAVQSGAQVVKGIYTNGGSAASTGAMTILCYYFTP